MFRIQICILSILILLAGCKNKPGNGTGQQAVAIRTVPVSMKRLSQPVPASGFLSTEAEMKLSFKTGGVVERLFVREGQRVRRGQILARLKLDEIRAYADQAQSGYEKARRDFDRAQNLFRDSVATLEQVQDAQTGLNVAKANMDIAAFNLGHSQITAPADGIVLKRIVEENELVGPGYPIYFFGTEGNDWIVKVGVVDRDAVRLAVGDSAFITFDAFPGRIFPSTIRSLSGAPDPMSGVYEAELNVRRGKERFINGLMADAEIYPSLKHDYSVVPFEALVDVNGLDGFVYTASADSTAMKIPVTIGFFTGRIAAIEKGLKPTDRVVTEGAAYLDAGMRVREIHE